MNFRPLLSLTVAGAIVAGSLLAAEPAHAGRRAFIGGLVGAAVAGAMVGGAIAAAPTPSYYYGGPEYVVQPPPPPIYAAPPVYPAPYYRPRLCPPGYLCR